MKKRKPAIFKTIILYTTIIQLILNGLHLCAQTYEPRGLHVAGGFCAQKEYLFDWSAGEQIAIQTFQSASSMLLSTGLIQSKNARVINIQQDKMYDIMVKAGPTPIHSFLFLSIREIGVLIQAIQIINAQGIVLYKITGPFDGIYFNQSIQMDTFPSGYYFVLIQYNVDKTFEKTKIIKILKQ